MSSPIKTRKKGLGWGDMAVVCLGLAVIAALQVEPASKASKASYVSDYIVEYYGPAPAPEHPEAVERYDKLLRSKHYFAAFAYASDGSFGWADNYTSQDLADAVALEHCSEYSDSCRIIAQLRPTLEIQFEDQVLSFTQGAALNHYQTVPTQKAIAFTEEGAWGSAWNHAFPASAQQSALASCRKNVEKQRLAERSAAVCKIIKVN